jgi:hypothetical protein
VYVAVVVVIGIILVIAAVIIFKRVSALPPGVVLVKAYTFNCRAEDRSDILLKNQRLNPAAIAEVTLTADQANRLMRGILIERWTRKPCVVAEDFVPHYAFVFYDHDGNPVRFCELSVRQFKDSVSEPLPACANLDRIYDLLAELGLPKPTRPRTE